MSIRPIDITVGNTPVQTSYCASYPDFDGIKYIVPTYNMTVSGTTDGGKKESQTWEVIRYGVHKKPGGSPRIVGLSSPKTYTVSLWRPGYTLNSTNAAENGAWRIYKGWLIHDGPDTPLASSPLYGAIGCIEVCGKDAWKDFNDFIVKLGGSTEARAKALIEIGSSKKLKVRFLKGTPPKLKTA